MTVEYILLLTVYVAALMGVMMGSPRDSFFNSGPRLAARVEVHLETGDGFLGQPRGLKNAWTYPE